MIFPNLKLIVFVALLAAFIVLLIKKWGLAEWMQVHGDKFMSQLFSCDLCMSFWAAMLLSAFLAGYTDDVLMFVIPFFTTPVTRMLV